jgi:CrcB protein
MITRAARAGGSRAEAGLAVSCGDRADVQCAAVADTLRVLVAALPVDPDLDEPGRPLARGHVLALIAVGGVAGSLARAGLAAATPVAARGWPTATLLCNVLGSLLLAVVLTGQHERYPHVRWVRPLLGTGFCGGFTTFSTFAVETTTRAGESAAPLAVAYVVLSIVLCLVAVAAGVLGVRAGLRLADREALARRVERAGARGGGAG